MPDSIFITGTDTNVGKTFVMCEMLKALRARGVDAVGFKPVECGPERSDSCGISEACGLPVDAVNPVWYQTPVAPLVAAEKEGNKWNTDQIFNHFEKLEKDHDMVLVEGAGGWLVPIEEGFLVSNLAIGLGLGVVAVAANRLGVINHTMLTARSVAQDLDLLGVILNDADELSDESRWSNEEVLSRQIDAPTWKWNYGQRCPEMLISAFLD